MTRLASSQQRGYVRWDRRGTTTVFLALVQVYGSFLGQSPVWLKCTCLFFSVGRSPSALLFVSYDSCVINSHQFQDWGMFIAPGTRARKGVLCVCMCGSLSHLGSASLPFVQVRWTVHHALSGYLPRRAFMAGSSLKRTCPCWGKSGHHLLFGNSWP